MSNVPVPAPAKKRRFVDWSGNYQVLLNSSFVATITVTRQWTPGGMLHIATLDDGRSETRGDGASAIHAALQLVAPGEPVLPWYPSCDERGWRLKALETLGRAPWTVSEEDSDGR